MAADGAPDTFLTLTANPKCFESPDARAQALVKAWRTIRRRAQKKYGYDSIPFLAVFEATKRGEPHLHILLRVKWLDQEWLSAQLEELTGAKIVDIRRVKGRRQAAAYVTKYVGKSPGAFEGCKRYWKSQDYIIKDEADEETDDYDPSEWEVVKRGWLDLCDLLCKTHQYLGEHEGTAYFRRVVRSDDPP